MTNDGYVYIIETDFGVKIGVSKRPDKRMAHLQCTVGVPFKRTFVSQACSNHYGIESHLHRRFGYCRGNGEWFRADFDEVCAELRRCHFDHPVPAADDSIERAKAAALIDALFPLPRPDRYSVCAYK